MIHDLLLALLGFTGDLIQRSDEGGLEIRKSCLREIEKFDESIIISLLQIAAMYKRITEWADRTIRRRVECMYSRLLAFAIQEELVTLYTRDIADLEKRILNDGVGNSQIYLFMENNWRSVLEGLAGVVDDGGSEIHILDRLIDMSDKVSLRDDRGVIRNLKIRLINGVIRDITVWIESGYSIKGGVIGRHPVRLLDNGSYDKLIFIGNAKSILKNDFRQTFGEFSVSTSTVVVKGQLGARIERIRCEVSEALYQRLIQPGPDNLNRTLCSIGKYVLMGSWDPFSGYADIDTMGIDEIQELISEGPVMVVPDHLCKWTLRVNICSPVMKLVIQDSEMYIPVFKRLYQISHARHVLSRSQKEFAYLPLSNALSQVLFALSFYYQCDVIEPRFSKLRAFVDACTDIQELASQHALTVTKINFEMLLSFPGVNDCIEEIVRLAESVSRDAVRGVADDEEVYARVMDVTRKLVDELQGLQVGYNIAAIERLVLKLDFNSFYRQQI